MPDHPKASADKGLYDEEIAVTDALWSLGQDCDTRFIELWQISKNQHQVRKTGKKFGTGRIVVNSSHKEHHAMIYDSELAVHGRSSADDAIIQLPSEKEFLYPCGDSP